jgi:adenine-specific DNA methylase
MAEPSRNSSSKGIDISLALDILAQRQQVPHVHDHSHPVETSSANDGHLHHHNNINGTSECANHQHVIPNAPSLGQVIDLEQASAVNNDAVDEVRISQERQARQEELQHQLEHMTMQELLRQVVQVQETRVATYKSFDK